MILAEQGENPFGIVVEAKQHGTITEAQSNRYRREIDHGHVFRKVRERNGVRLLVGLSATPAEIKGINKQIRWSDVAEWCTKKLKDEKPEVSFVLQQFRDFIEEKGLMVKPDRSNPDMFKWWQSTNRYREQLCLLLKSLPEYCGAQDRLKNKPKVEGHDAGEKISYLGIYHITPPYLWAGFAFNSSESKVYLVVERDFCGRKEVLLKSFSGQLQKAYGDAERLLECKATNKDGKIWFPFAQEMDEDLDGKPEKILDWFKSIILEVEKVKVEDQ